MSVTMPDQSTEELGNKLPFCDLVMKGGVTSGVVYPAAIYAISRSFDIKSIGGTSAGAIAAALAAAAQFRRVRAGEKPDGEAGYEHVHGIPEVLGSNGTLLKLFAPNVATKPLFRLVMDLFSQKGHVQKVFALSKAYPALALGGCFPGALYATATWSNPSLPLKWLHIIVAVIVGIGFSVLASTAGMVIDLLRRLPANYYGLVTGVDGSNDLALCTWLTRELEVTAGLTEGEFPLTFGMLWNPKFTSPATEIEDAPKVRDRAVNLQMVTTSLTEGRPYQFPTRTNRYYFKRDELKYFFPPHVVKWMVDNARRRDPTKTPLPEGMTPLPLIGDLPVIVATRMSLSFPILLSAVPLYSIDHNDPEPQLPQRVWFSDGGLTNNFPITMFDSSLPRWPTLAINLGSASPRKPNELLLLPETSGEGRLLPFSKVNGLLTFLGAIFGTMQNWQDNMQSTQPGFRDRIVTIVMRPNEGGLNLKMDSDTIASLRARGEQAGQRLVERFSPASTLTPGTPLMSWEGHRWTRLRASLDMIRRHLSQFSVGWGTPLNGDVPYADLIECGEHDTVPVRSFPLKGPACRTAVGTCGLKVSDLGADLKAELCLQNHLPHPIPSLVVRPNLDESQPETV